MLVADNITVNLSGKTIVSNMNVTVKKGDFVGLIGPNGSGKSTFLRSIYQAINYTEGCVYLEKKNMKDMSYKQVAQELSVVSQMSNIQFEFTVMQMVLLGRTPYKKLMEPNHKKDYHIARQSLNKVGLEGFEDRLFSTLSGGEKQRVILARAFAQETNFMILDEPTNHLDIKSQLTFFNLVKKEQKTIFAAMHDLNLAATYCNQIFVIDKGSLKYHGETQKILNEKVIYEIFGVKTERLKTSTGALSISYIP